MIMESIIDILLEKTPFGLADSEKEEIFLPALRNSFSHHMRNNSLFRQYCERRNFNPDKAHTIADFPYLPVNIFKNQKLSSVPDENIKAVLNSSATTGVPSSVVIDTITSRRQTIASAKVMADYLGDNRRPFLIFDEDPSKTSSSEISARSAATRGFLMFASSAEYFLTESNGSYSLDIQAFEKALSQYTDKIAVFGFTFVLYHFVIKPLLNKDIQFSLPEGSKVVHIGGWKKLESQKVSKDKFNEDIHSILGVEKSNIIDFYGFTEQMGLVYADCKEGYKHVPLYSEILIRDFQTLEPVQDGQEGLIQILTPLPYSYPGVSVLTDDVGVIKQRGKCKCGRYGTAFQIVGRAKRSEPRGCGDILSDKMR